MSFNLPDDLLYSKEHEWVKIEGNIYTMGITDFAQHQLTDIVFVELPEVGREIEKDESFTTVESVKSVSDIFAPLSGKIVEVNLEVEDAPELINSSPYEDGWICKVELSDKTEIDSLLSLKEYEDFISDEE
jgi:glycine cleavage system H protein